MSEGPLGDVLRGVRCLLLDFDGPVCSVFARLPARLVADEMRRDLLAEGIALEGEGFHTEDPLRLLSCAAEHSPRGQVRAESLLMSAEREAVRTAEPTPGAREMLMSARAAHVRIVIVSNNSQSAVDAYLARAQLGSLVDGVVGRDPRDASLMKPNRHLVGQALGLLDPAIDHKPVLVGDSPSDMYAGAAAGLPVIGFANKPGKLRELAAAGAEAVIEDFDQMISIIQKS